MRAKVLWNSESVDFWLRDMPVRIPKHIKNNINRRGREGVAIVRGEMSGRLPTSKTGNLITSVRYRVFTNTDQKVGVLVGPMGKKGSHRHLVEGGHRIVGHAPNKVETGHRARPNPRIAAARPRVEAVLQQAIDEALELAIREA